MPPINRPDYIKKNSVPKHYKQGRELHRKYIFDRPSASDAKGLQTVVYFNILFGNVILLLIFSFTAEARWESGVILVR